MIRQIATFFITVWATIVVLCLPLHAQVQTPEQLALRYSDSLVFFQNPDDPTKPRKGYGVVVSSAGHVLTVAHVVALFGKAEIQGSVGRPTGALRTLSVV